MIESLLKLIRSVLLRIKSISLATLTGMITLFILGYLIYDSLGVGAMIYDGPSAASCLKTEVSISALIVTEFSTAFLITFIYAQWAKIRTFKTGAVNGLWIGMLLALMVMSDYYSVTELTSSAGIFTYVVTNGIRMAIAAGLIGVVLGRIERT